MSNPQHCDQPMYHDTRDGHDMARWLCAVPGCTAVISDVTIAAGAEMAWADEHGILLPGVTIIGNSVGQCDVPRCGIVGPHQHDIHPPPYHPATDRPPLPAEEANPHG